MYRREWERCTKMFISFMVWVHKQDHSLIPLAQVDVTVYKHSSCEPGPPRQTGGRTVTAFICRPLSSPLPQGLSAPCSWAPSPSSLWTLHLHKEIMGLAGIGQGWWRKSLPSLNRTVDQNHQTQIDSSQTQGIYKKKFLEIRVLYGNC